VKLFRDGKTVTEVAKALGIGRGSVYRALQMRNADDYDAAEVASPCDKHANSRKSEPLNSLCPNPDSHD
jgi:transposase